jgi:hypothetical protein
MLWRGKRASEPYEASSGGRPLREDNIERGHFLEQ